MEGTINPDTGKAPDRRFINPKDKADGEWAYTYARKFVTVGNTRDLERREAESMLRHAPPYSDADMKALNMENMPNSTMGELPRRVSEEEGKWTDYVVSSSGLWKIVFPMLPPESYDTISERFSGMINELWMDDSKHVLALQLCFRQFAVYGIGPMVWEDCYCPTPISRVASDLKFTPGTRLTLDNFSECSLRDSCTPQELYATIRGPIGEMRSKLHGWNRAEVMKVLKHYANNPNMETDSVWGGTLEQVELRERQGENIWTKYQNNEVSLIHVFVKEYEPDDDGHCFSHITLANDGARWRIIRDNGYKYSSPWQFMVLATDRVGSDMTIAGLRGMGIDLLEHCRSMDVMYNASMYAAYRSSIPVYTSNGASGAQNADQVSIRPNGVIIPQGFTEAQTHIDFQAGGWMLDRLSNLADRHQKMYDINSPNKGGVQRTKGEAVLDAAKESDARSNQILPIVRLFFEPLGREFVRRLMEFPKDNKGVPLKYKGWELVTKFWMKLGRMMSEHGIPLAALADYRLTINPANTPGGLDKKLMRSQALMQFYPLVQTQPQRNWIVNQGIISIAGYEASKAFLNKDEPKNPVELDIQIDSENADMVSGYQRTVYPEQDHLRHMGPLAAQGSGHVPFMMVKLNEMQQGIFDKFSMVTMKGHMDAHLAMLAQNPVIMDMPEVQGYFDFAAQIEQILLQSIKHFEKQMQERNPDGQTDPKIAALLAKTKAEIQAMEAKTKADIDAMNLKHMVKLGNMEQTSEARREHKNAEFILGEVVKQKQAASDLAISGMSNVLDLKAERQKIEMQEKKAREAKSE
jgi:hypothetical protein